ncbi:MAG: transcriptional regulator [Bacteroidetes bacterium]|nr:transcriptional regulator [Bacteroidota bacterium]
MAIEIITKEDLANFKAELLNDIKQLLESSGKMEQKKWLRSPEVRKILNISPGTLQNLRINGTLAYTKVGSILFYSADDIEKVLAENKIDHSKLK